jgi:hypothetical protein
MYARICEDAQAQLACALSKKLEPGATPIPAPCSLDLKPHLLDRQLIYAADRPMGPPPSDHPSDPIISVLLADRHRLLQVQRLPIGIIEDQQELNFVDLRLLILAGHIMARTRFCIAKLRQLACFWHLTFLQNENQQ